MIVIKDFLFMLMLSILLIGLVAEMRNRENTVQYY